MADTPDVSAFLRAAGSVLRDTLNKLAADLDVHPSHISIGYTYDAKTSAFGWRVAIEMGHATNRSRAYAFDPDLLVAIERMIVGFRRIESGESILTTDTDKDYSVH